MIRPRLLADRIARNRCKDTPRDVCFYCGDYASGVDHVIPYVLARHDTELVSCCAQCNSLLSATVFPDKYAKGAYIYKVLRKRYSAVIACKNRWADELDDFRPRLLASIREDFRIAAEAELRIKWASRFVRA